MKTLPCALESTPTQPEQPQGHGDVAQQRHEIPLAERTYLTPREAVTYLGLSSLNALQQRMKRRTIPTWVWTRMGGKSLRFLRSALDEWLGAETRRHLIRGTHGAQSVVSFRSKRGDA